MIIFTLKIAGGNPTALVYKSNSRKKIVKELLKKVEQIGFVSKIKKIPELKMMGGELCINATLAFASTLKNEGKLYTSGLNGLIEYKNKDNKTTIKFPLKYKKNKNIILFEGIGFIFVRKKKITKRLLSIYCSRYKLPAFGAIIYKGNKIIPYIYVKRADSFVKETACGSGSIAYGIFIGERKIIQPTGKAIYVKLGKLIEVSANISKENLIKFKRI